MRRQGTTGIVVGYKMLLVLRACRCFVGSSVLRDPSKFSTSSCFIEIESFEIYSYPNTCDRDDKIQKYSNNRNFFQGSIQ